MWILMLEDNCCDQSKTRRVPDQMPSTHSQDLLAQHRHKRKTEKLKMDTGRNYANTAVAGTCLQPALQPHHLNSSQMDLSGQEKEGTAKRDLAAHCGERPQYQGTEFPHGIQSSSRPCQMRQRG